MAEASSYVLLEESDLLDEIRPAAEGNRDPNSCSALYGLLPEDAFHPATANTEKSCQAAPAPAPARLPCGARDWNAEFQCIMECRCPIRRGQQIVAFETDFITLLTNCLRMFNNVAQILTNSDD